MSDNRKNVNIQKETAIETQRHESRKYKGESLHLIFTFVTKTKERRIKDKQKKVGKHFLLLPLLLVTVIKF